MKIILTLVLSLMFTFLPSSVLACIRIEGENRSLFEKATDWMQHSISVYPVTALVVLVVLRVILKRKGIQKYSKTLTVLSMVAVVVGVVFFILENLIKSTTDCI